MDKKMIMLNKHTENKHCVEQLYGISPRALKSILETRFTLLEFSMDTLFNCTGDSPLQKVPLLLTSLILKYTKKK